MKQKFICLVLFAFTIHVAAFAQPAIKHQRTIGGNSVDELTSIYLTNDGGLIAGGLSFSDISGEKTENSRGLDDYWIIKLDSNGNIQWDKTFGGSGADELKCLQQTNDGGYILGGYSNSNISGEKTQNSRGNYDYWVVKVDSVGNIQWDKTIGGSDHDELTSLQQSNDGGYILGGWSISNISGEKTQDDRGIEDYWVLKLDNAGNIQWDKTIGGMGEDKLTSIQQTYDAGYMLGGYSASGISGEKTQRSRGSEDYWVVKLGNSGNIEWDRTIGGRVQDLLLDLQQTRDSGYILGGYSSSGISGEKTEANRGCCFSYDYWIVRLNKNGKIKWDKTIGGDDYDWFASLDQTADNGFIVGGTSESNISGEKTENSRRWQDYWVIKVSNQGQVEWDKTIGGNDHDYFSSIKEIERNQYVLGGWSNSPLSGDKTQQSRGYDDYWLVELKYTNQDSLTVSALPNANSLKSADNYTNQFLAFPNPVKDILNIQINGKATFTLTNQSGKIILTKNINSKG